MKSDLQELMELARFVEMTAEEQELQRRSFAYGSALIENSNITRNSIQRAAEEMTTGRKQIVDERVTHLK